MTREEAIEIVQAVKFIDDFEDYSDRLEIALDMAIEALKDRPHGKWIRRHIINGTDWAKSFDMYVCSNCGEEFSYDAETGISMNNYNTCPNCGSDNRKGASE